MNTFEVGQLIFYKNGDRVEIGKIKSLKEHGAFVFYHGGSTSALTNYKDMLPIVNEMNIVSVNLGQVDEDIDGDTCYR